MTRQRALLVVTLTAGMILLSAWWAAELGTVQPVHADTFCAPSSSYTTIQAAIDAASDGDTVQIVYGTWYENLNVTDGITLAGGWTKGCTDRTKPEPQHTTIDGSAADHVVEINGDSNVTLDGLTITNGYAQKGGGVYVSEATATLNKVVVTNNVISPTGSGGFNPANWAYGGGVYVYMGTVTLKDCEITYNTSDPASSDICFGGGLALESEALDPAIAVIESTQIMSNTNPSDSTLYGAGLYLDPQSQVTFQGTDNLIAYNEAKAGGGVYMYGDVDLEGVLIAENYASQNGGGIFVSSGYSGGKVANNYLVRNNANQSGASVVASDVDVEIANNTIVGDLTGTGAGIEVVDTGTGVAELTNNIVVSHTIGIRRSNNGFASMTLTNNDVWGNTTNYDAVSSGTGDISVDPEFEDPDNDDYHLAADSPCINAGAYVEGLRYDYDGDRRTGTLLDIGADEYHMDPFFVPLTVKSYTP
jgi:hypothetical protein